MAEEGEDVTAGLGVVLATFLLKSNFSRAGADGAEAGAVVLEGAPNIDSGVACADVDVGAEEGSTLGFANVNGVGLLVSVLGAAGAGKVLADEGAANCGCAGVGLKVNEGVVEGAAVTGAGAGVEGAAGLEKKLGMDAVVGAMAVVGSCVVGGPNEDAGAAGAVCRVDEVVNRLSLLAAGAEVAGATLAGVAVDPVVAADFEASVLVDVGPNGNNAGVGFVSVPEDVAVDAAGGGGVNVMMGTIGALGPSSGAVVLVGSSEIFPCGVSAFFCSSIRARILAIASASRSCFSHFENARNPGREGPSATLGINGGV